MREFRFTLDELETTMPMYACAFPADLAWALSVLAAAGVDHNRIVEVITKVDRFSPWVKDQLKRRESRPL